jgi:hypothetical protein
MNISMPILYYFYILLSDDFITKTIGLTKIGNKLVDYGLFEKFIIWRYAILGFVHNYM